MEDLFYKNAKILVVDDVEEVLNSTKNSLRFEGMEVECFLNPIEALEYLKTNKVDVLLLDFFMPQMNGDKFIEQLRQFNNETIVILRTGYSDKVPPMEMLDSLNIQGYIDKLNGNDELILMTKSAIKTAHLYKQILEQKKQIDMLQYKNEFFGKFLYRLLGEIRERAMIIGGLSEIMAENNEDVSKEDNIKYSKEINKAIEKLQNVARNLEVDDLGMIKIERLSKIISDLFELDFKIKNVKLNIIYNENIDINCDSKIILYIMVEIIEFLIKNGITEININVEGNTKFIINGVFSRDLVTKIMDIATKSDENIKILYDNECLKIEII